MCRIPGTSRPPATNSQRSRWRAGIIRGVLVAEVSWRREPGINRAYVWLSDGTVAGYRDLDTGLDHPTARVHASLLDGVLAEWLATHGVGWIGSPREPILNLPRGRGPVVWLRGRKALRKHEQAVTAYREWRLDHPAWKVPIDPPHGGWRDLVRNDPGEALWHRAAEHHQDLRRLELAEWRAARAWQKGAVGEEGVAVQLWRLSRPGNWRYVHSVPVGDRGSDIDHVLVGPPGVFTINTKAHREANVWVGGDTVMVNGRKHPYVRNSRHEAARASRLLTAALGWRVPVRGVIVFVDPRNFTIRDEPVDVAVTTRYGLNRWARSLPTVLSDQHVDAIFDRVRRSTTWQATTSRDQ